MSFATLGFLLLLSPAQVGGGTQPGTLALGLSGSNGCAQCHAQGNTALENLASDGYRGTMMDLASYDPFFLAALEIANVDSLATSELCIKCHMPTGWLAGRGLGDGSALRANDKQGVACDLCHRMEIPPPLPNVDAGTTLGDGGVNDGGVNDAGSTDGGIDEATSTDAGSTDPLDRVLIGNGQFFIADSQVKHGPAGSDRTNGHTSEYSPLFRSSKLCAHCHNVENPFIAWKDAAGNALTGPMPIERTYSEWAQSDFALEGPDAKTCQGCHMRAFDGTSATVGAPPVRQLGRHDIVGGNTIGGKMVLSINEGAQRPAFLQNIDANVDAIALEANRMLREESAELSAVLATGDSLLIRLTNKTGHKLPTGYPEGRRMFLSTDVTWADGASGPKTGTPDLDTFNFVEGQDPLRIWETRLGNAEGTSFRFLQVDRILKDNRIPPKGFRPTPDTVPVAQQYPEVSPGVLQHWDDVIVPLGTPGCYPALVDVWVQYQSVSGLYFDFLIENAPAYAPTLQAAWDAVGGSVPVEMVRERYAVFADGRVEVANGVYTCQQPEPDAGPTDAGTVPLVDAGTEAPSRRVDAGPGAVGTPSPDPIEESCSCLTTNASNPPPFLLGLVLVLGLQLRRQRRFQLRG